MGIVLGDVVGTVSSILGGITNPSRIEFLILLSEGGNYSIAPILPIFAILGV